MEHGFSATPHHGLELSGGAPETDDVSSPTADPGAAAATESTPTANGRAVEPTSESEYVNTEPKLSKTKYKRHKIQLKKQQITVVFNESQLKLTPDMETVLNKGLKFAITPHKLDITQVLTEFRRFERIMVWTEFWFGKAHEETYKPSLFKQKKSNFPRNHKTHRGLQDYLAAVKSEIMDPKNRHKTSSNLSPGEQEALKELVK